MSHAVDGAEDDWKKCKIKHSGSADALERRKHTDEDEDDDNIPSRMVLTMCALGGASGQATSISDVDTGDGGLRPMRSHRDSLEIEWRNDQRFQL